MTILDREASPSGRRKRAPSSNVVTPDDFWRKDLIRSAKGVPKAGLANVMHVLSLHPEWSRVLAYDLFTESVMALEQPPARGQDRPEGEFTPGDWSESDSVRTASWFESEVGFKVGADLVTQAVVAVAERRKVHPVREWLKGLEWDGVLRLDKLLSRYFGAVDDDYTSAVGVKFMVAAVARVVEPGCKCDTMLILEGDQGIRKSTGVKVLAGEWYADTGVAVGDKDSYQSLRGVWLYEFAELAAVKGREAERVKNFLSSSVDHYRPSYGRKFRDFPRQCVFIATTNETNYLVDRTGNRRFWPVKCGVTRNTVDVEGLRADRAQLWAEAVVRYEGGEVWHVDSSELAELFTFEQRDRLALDDWTPIVDDWLRHPTVPDNHGGRSIVDLSKGLTTVDVLLGAIGMRASDVNQSATTRIGPVLNELGFKKQQKSEKGKRSWRYFRQDSPGQSAEKEE